VNVSPFFTATWMPPANPAQAPTPLVWPTRAAIDVRPYALDLENWLMGSGDTLASFQFGTTSSTLAVSYATVAGTQCIVTLSGGTAGELAEIDIIAATAGGIVETFRIAIATSSFSSVTTTTGTSTDPTTTPPFPLLGVPGAVGATGPTGPTGPQGASIVSSTITNTGELLLGLSNGNTLDAGTLLAPATFSQSSAATTWTINHNLNRHPAVTVVDSAGTLVDGDVQYSNANTIVVSFSAAFAGNAYLN
jgi:hypothetical protein